MFIQNSPHTHTHPTSFKKGKNSFDKRVLCPCVLYIHARTVAPTCKPNQARVHGVAKQEKAEIKCQVDANPPDVQFRWTFNNSAESVDVAASHIARTGTSSVVSYTPMTELDYGTLLCYASNRVGQQRVPCVFHIIAAGKTDVITEKPFLLNSLHS